MSNRFCKVSWVTLTHTVGEKGIRVAAKRKVKGFRVVASFFKRSSNKVAPLLIFFVSVVVGSRSVLVRHVENIPDVPSQGVALLDKG